MEALARESELRAELAAIMAQSDELLAALHTGRERMQVILKELEGISAKRIERLSGK